MVIANACTDNTKTLLELYKTPSSENSKLPLTWFTEKIPGKSHALNRAIPELHSDLVAFMDDDHRIDTNYFNGIYVAAESYPDTSMFCGRMLPDWDGSESSWFHDTGPYRVYPFPVPRYDQGDTPRQIEQNDPIPSGGNIIMRRQVLERVGEFAEDLGPQGHNLGGGEDKDYILRALKSGEQMLYIPNIKQFHYVDPDRLRLGYLLKKSFLRSRDEIRIRQNTYKKVPPYMWRKLMAHVFNASLPFKWSRKRFYLMRIAATLGEIRGIQLSKQRTFYMGL